MATEKKQQHQLTVKDPQKAWRVIEDLMLDDEELTIAELDAELREVGIDPDECINKVFQAAEKIARDPNQPGQVSPHVSNFLSQLAQRHRSEAKAASDDEHSAKDDKTHAISAEGTQQARAAVRTSYRNYNKTSENDRKILDSGERFLQEKAKRLEQEKQRGK